MYTVVNKNDFGSVQLSLLLVDDIVEIRTRKNMERNWTALIPSSGKLVICYGEDTKTFSFISGILHEMAHLIYAAEEKFYLPEFGIKVGGETDILNIRLTETQFYGSDAWEALVLLTPVGRHEFEVFAIQYLLSRFCFPYDENLFVDNSLSIVNLSSGTPGQKSAAYKEIFNRIVEISKKYDINGILKMWFRRVEILKELKNREEYRDLLYMHVKKTIDQGFGDFI